MIFIFFILLVFKKEIQLKIFTVIINTLYCHLFFLVHSIFDNNPSQDANMYHFYLQNLISSQKIIFGLSNFDPLYGFCLQYLITLHQVFG